MNHLLEPDCGAPSFLVFGGQCGNGRALFQEPEYLGGTRCPESHLSFSSYCDLEQVPLLL